MVKRIKKMIWRIKFELDWYQARKDGVIIDEEEFNDFYCSDNIDIRNWYF